VYRSRLGRSSVSPPLTTPSPPRLSDRRDRLRWNFSAEHRLGLELARQIGIEMTQPPERGQAQQHEERQVQAPRSSLLRKRVTQLAARARRQAQDQLLSRS